MLSVNEIQDIIKKKFNSLIFNGYPAELYEPVIYTLNLGGKRIRPVLLLMSCDMFGGEIENATDAAAGLELFHNFTLIHDDIMDNAPIRRGKETVFKKWNSNTAILSGDTMFALAYKQVIKTQSPHLNKILDLFTKTAIEVCEGQQYDLNFESCEDVSIKDYLEMIRLKTAVLIGASLKIGALLAGCPNHDSDNIYSFGENIGMAFQLKDDFLDTFGNEEKFGKKTGGDIAENKKTFLYVKALEIADPITKEQLISCYRQNKNTFDMQQKIKLVTDIFLRLGIDKIMEKEMNNYFHKALKYFNLILLPENKKKSIIDYSYSLLYRDN